MVDLSADPRVIKANKFQRASVHRRMSSFYWSSNSMTKRITHRPLNKPGPAPLYSDPNVMEAKIDLYFKNCPDKDKNKQPCPTISGLVLYLGFCDRHQFYTYEKNPLFSNTIKKARAQIEKVYESLLRTQSCTGAIFALKNFGWKDNYGVEHGGEIALLEKYKDLSIDQLTERLKGFIGSPN